MPLPEFSRGTCHCLRLLFWYSRRYKRVHPSQKTLAKGLRVSDRQVRTYLAELKAAGWLSVRQGHRFLSPSNSRTEIGNRSAGRYRGHP